MFGARNMRPPRLGPAAQLFGGGRPLGDVPTDGPAGVKVPTTSAHWTALGIPVPTLCYGCQDASGNLVPSIGSVQLAPNGTGKTYEATVSGWSRKFVTLAEGNVGARWGTADAAFDRASGETICALIYAVVTAVGGNRRFLSVYDTVNAVWMTATGVPQSRVNGSNVSGLVDHRHATTVRPYLWTSDGVNNVSATLTDLEQISNTHNETALSGATKGLGATDAGEPPACKICLFAFWKAPSRAIVKADLQTLGWSLAY